MTWERVFIRVQLGAVVVLLLTAVVWGPRTLIQSVMGVGAPLSGELVPRQIPYRGYLEKDGIPLPSSAGQAFGFTLEFGDGGTAWSEPFVTLPVSNGHFEVALGDNAANKIPQAVFADPFVLLSITVGGVPLSGKQRLLSVPYAQASANGVPPGTIIAFGGEVVPNVPHGWLLCDGTPVTAAQFPSLCAAIGVSWGSAGPGQCRLPDLRGQFLRGAHGAGVDADGNRPVGGSQTAATARPNVAFETGIGGSHTHAISGSGYLGAGGVTGSFPYGNNVNLTQIIVPTGGAHEHVIQVGGDLETRPKNQAVNFLIKY